MHPKTKLLRRLASLSHYIKVNGLLDNSEINRTSSAELFERRESKMNVFDLYRITINANHSLCM